MSDHFSTEVSCRHIGIADFPAILDLLHVGFPKRSRSYWVEGLRRLAGHTPPDGSPKYGYLLVSGEILVGVLLQIFSCTGNEATTGIRCNLSSWYVRPDFRAYAAFLTLRAIRNDSITYVNVWPAKHTLPTIEAQGFKKATGGFFAGLPALGRLRHDVTIMSRGKEWNRSKLISAAQLRLLADHEEFGCVCLWCETKTEGRPFIFRKRLTWYVPCAMLIYSNSIEDIEEFARPIGSFLCRKGMPIMLVGSERPLRGVTGKYFATKLHIYYKGIHKPRGSDLSYTDAAIFGV